MNEPIETMLRNMPLARPSADLDRRVLSSRPARPLVLRLGAALALGAAAATILVVLATREQPGPALPGPRALASAPAPATGVAPAANPVCLEQNWSTIEYQGVLDSADQGPLRAYRQQTLQRMVILDANGRPTEVNVPRQNVILVSAEQY